MSVHAGSILHIGGNNVIDRIQSAGLGDVRVPVETIREVGNDYIVDKIQGDADFTFSVEALDVSTEPEAWLTGSIGAGLGSAQGPGAADAEGTEYKLTDCGFLNITSPWKDPSSGDDGDIHAGHIIPGYYVRRVRWRFGVSDQATQEIELGGGQFYYGDYAPTEQFETGDGVDDTFTTDDPAVRQRRGGVEGTSFRHVFGVIVDGELQTEGVDYEQSAAAGVSAVATVTFTDPPANGADIRFCYFTTAAVAWPQARHASTVTKPAAVRGRNICVYLGSGVSRAKLGNVQSAEVEWTQDGTVEREFCNEEIVGFTINGTDTRGEIVIRAKNKDAFFAVLSKITGVAVDEVFGYLNTYDIPLEIAIQNPKNPAQILKTLYVSDAIFSIPGTPARVNTPTDFTISFESQTGDLSVFKGAKP